MYVNSFEIFMLKLRSNFFPIASLSFLSSPLFFFFFFSSQREGNRNQGRRWRIQPLKSASIFVYVANVTRTTYKWGKWNGSLNYEAGDRCREEYRCLTLLLCSSHSLSSSPFLLSARRFFKNDGRAGGGPVCSSSLSPRAKNALVHAVSRKKIEVPRMETTVVTQPIEIFRRVGGCVTLVWNWFSLLIGPSIFLEDERDENYWE